VKLQDKVVLVTGASKGIGRALAWGLAREGAHLVVNYNTDHQGAETVAEEIVRLGRQALTVQADVSQVAQIHAMFASVGDRFGRLDVLINNAAITEWGDLFAITEQKWDRVIDTNLKGTFFCAQEAAKMMKSAGGGCIVNVSTSCTMLAVTNLVAYTASKGGIHALTKHLALALAPHKIRVNTFAPGPTLNERNLRDDPNYDQTFGSVVPLGRAARPEEMVPPAVFLASDDSSYMTGQIVYIDGGWTAGGKMPEKYFDQAAQSNQ
jgi:NAD(P)-dependent dehydrogenase (short-subunit alcohol dehydrogenase family)